METSLRIVLLLLAVAILIGIVWDIMGSRRQNRKLRETRKNPFAKKTHDIFSNEKEEFDDVILINPSAELKEKEAGLIKKPKVNSSSKKAILEQKSSSTKSSPSSSLYSKDLIILNVMARQPGVFHGKKLYEFFQEAHLYYGEMNIFHRHENADGGGKIVFSLASALEPGIFEISKLETLVTPGLTLFFQIERPNQAIAAFELMLRTAKQLAMRLDAEIKDDAHHYLTLPLIEKYRERVRLAKATAQ